MGEARRRRLAGTSPTPAEDFRVSAGTVAITIDVHDVSPSTLAIDAGKVVDVIDEVNRVLAGMDYYTVVHLVVSQFTRARRSGGDKAFEWIGLGCLWTALHHPVTGTNLRAAVSYVLRRYGCAHLTWQYARDSGLAIAVGGHFVDLERLAATVPKDGVRIYQASRDSDSETQH